MFVEWLEVFAEDNFSYFGFETRIQIKLVSFGICPMLESPIVCHNVLQVIFELKLALASQVVRLPGTNGTLWCGHV